MVCWDLQALQEFWEKEQFGKQLGFSLGSDLIEREDTNFALDMESIKGQTKEEETKGEGAKT